MNEQDVFGQCDPVAVIGFTVRLPGARDAEEFWRNLRDGVESIRFFSEEELLAAGVEPSLLARPDYVRAGAALEGVELFDAPFFGFHARQAEVTDPQQRLMLECAWEALERAGYAPNATGRATGVFVGSSLSHYLLDNLYPSLGSSSDIGSLPLLLGNDKDYLASLVSYKLNLRGPSINVQTACSTSLVAVHLACQSLLNGECDMALAGGVSVIPQRQREGYLYVAGGHYSPDGHCRTFDAAARGTVFGNGAGVVVLKRYADALADRDHIHAVIRGSAVNNDGSAKVGFTAPGVDGQAAVIAEALAVAGVRPESINYVEAHGTGTPLGDPIEIAALKEVFQECAGRKDSCALGSVKTNIGHLEAAAGVAGLVKTMLALKHKQLPPSLHFREPNPELGLADSPFFVNAKLREWEPGPTPRRAGVSSFGIGGTNAHVVLEESPAPLTEPVAFERPRQLLCLSAATETALAEQARRFAAHLSNEEAAPLADLCYTANAGRAHFAHRLVLAGRTREELNRGLEDFLSGAPSAAVSSGVVSERRRPKVAFLFTGQGSQYVGMGRQLYEQHPTFREALKECDRLYEQFCGEPLLPVLYAAEEAGSTIDETQYAQPALFAVGYALARLWRSWGVEPAAVTGHSLGEYVAACVAGVFGPAEGLMLVSRRGRLMQALRQKGAMAALFCDEERARRAAARHDGQVSIAAVNGPEDVVISGAEWAVGEVCAELEGAGVRTRRLNVSHAFHSSLIEPMLESFADVARGITYSAPQLPLVSNLTGQFWQKGVACDAEYWVRQARETVRFAEGLRTLRGHGCDLFLEVGPGQTLLSLGKKSFTEEGLAWLPSQRKGGDDWQVILQSLAALYVHGVGVDWEGFDRPYARRRVPAPTYPFERVRHWVESARRSTADDSSFDMRNAAARLFPGRRLKTALRESVFEAALSADSTPLLSDHRVYGTAVFPATGYVEMALASAAESAGAGPHVVEDFLVHQALPLREAEALTVQLVLTPRAAGESSFQIFSLEEGSDTAWRLHASGKVRASATADGDGRARVTEDVQALSARFAEPVPGELYYERLRGLGIEYGPSFRGVVTLWRREGEALGLVRPPSELSAARNPSEFRAALLDTCLQVVGGGLPAGRDGEELYLPVGFESARVWDELGDGGDVWSHAALRAHAAGAEAHTADLKIYGEDGRLLAEVNGLLLKRAPRAALLAGAERLDEWFYGIEWQRADAPRKEDAGSGIGQPEPGRWLVFDEGRGLGESLARLLGSSGEPCALVRPGDSFLRVSDGVWSIDPKEPEHYRQLLAECSGGLPLRGVVHLWSLHVEGKEAGEAAASELDDTQELICGSALFIVKALAGLGRADAPRLWLVTRGAQPVKEPHGSLSLRQSSLWGLGRVIAREHPEFWGGLVDLERGGSVEEAAWLAQAVGGRDVGEDQTAMRGGERYVVRLKRRQPVRKRGDAFALRGDSTYLITGGLGGLGLTVAKWMHERGARRLVLLGRGEAPPSERARKVIEELQGADTQVVVARADVGRAEQLARVLADVESSGWPLRGVVHAAGVVEDGTLLRQGWESFACVLAPKVAGGRNLHELTRTVPLDFFVLFSSVVSLAGPPGQGNYAAANAYLDALAHERRAQGLPAICINWGPWAEVGMAANGGRKEGARLSGAGEAITPASGVVLLEKVLTQEWAQVAVLPPGWLRLAQSMSSGRASSLWAELAGETRPPRASGNTALGRELMRRLETSPAGKRRALVVEYLQAEFVSMLGLDSSKPPDPRQGLFDLGLDSLMAIEFRTRLESTFKSPLPATLAFDYPSIEAVAAYLEEVLWPAAKGAEESPARPLEAEDGGRQAATVEQLELLSEEDAEAALLEKLARIEERV